MGLVDIPRFLLAEVGVVISLVTFRVIRLSPFLLSSIILCHLTWILRTVMVALLGRLLASRCLPD